MGPIGKQLVRIVALAMLGILAISVVAWGIFEIAGALVRLVGF
jgi:hypothetical protein